jgi:hypothetical protein
MDFITSPFAVGVINVGRVRAAFISATAEALLTRA